MKTVKEYSNTVHREVNIDVDALLATINKISEDEIKDGEMPHVIHSNGHTWHSYTELAEAFELDIHDFSVSEVNR